MLKKTFIVGFVASLTFLVMACGNDAEDTCEHTNEKCAIQQGFVKADCSKASDNYDKLSDADKEKADKQADCINDADTCEAILKCAVSG